MIPIKLSITYDPPQIGLFYMRHPDDHKKHIYIIQLHGLIFLGDTQKITQILFDQHSQYLSPKLIRVDQVEGLVDKLLHFLKTQLVEYEEEEQENECDSHGFANGDQVR